MITITEKDGATIIVFENPTYNEKKVIEQARKAMETKSSGGDIWSKFACNKNKSASSPSVNSVSSKPAEKAPAVSESEEDKFPFDDDYPL